MRYKAENITEGLMKRYLDILQAGLYGNGMSPHMSVNYLLLVLLTS